MAKKAFKGRVVLAGKVTGKATVSRHPFNTSGSYMENMFAGRTDAAPCTDASNKELLGKDLSNMILCTTTTVGSTMGGMCLMGMKAIGVGPEALLLLLEHGQALFQVAGEQTLHGAAVKADDLGQHIGSEQGLAPGLLLQHDLHQHRAGEVVAAVGVPHPQAHPGQHQLAHVRQGDVTARLGVVEAAIGVLLDQSHGIHGVGTWRYGVTGVYLKTAVSRQPCGAPPLPTADRGTPGVLNTYAGRR